MTEPTYHPPSRRAPAPPSRKPGPKPPSRPVPDEERATARVDGREVKVRNEIAQFARQQIGVPYKYAGTSPKTGFDCSGFTCYVLSNFDVRLPHSSGAQAAAGEAIDLEEAQTGDLIYFRDRSNGPVSHVAMVVSNTRQGLEVIHATNSRGVIVENISTSSYWRPKIDGARRVLRE